MKLSWTSKLHCQSFGITCDRWLNRDKLPLNHVCRHCYAATGNTRLSSVLKVLQANRRFINRLEPKSLTRNCLKMAKLIGTDQYFRWHHAGDLISVDHVRFIFGVCRHTPGTAHWLPVTPETYSRWFNELNDKRPANLTIRVSSFILGSDATSCKTSGTGGSTVYLDTVPWGHYACPGECSNCRVCWLQPGVKVAYQWHADAIVRLQARKAGLSV